MGRDVPPALSKHAPVAIWLMAQKIKILNIEINSELTVLVYGVISPTTNLLHVLIYFKPFNIFSKK